MDNAREANLNLHHFSMNRYPGRGIVLGVDGPGENMVQVYWIMGRSENSQNRVFGAEVATGRVFTEAANPAKVRDPSLIIYNAMMEESGTYVVSNGNQTDHVLIAMTRHVDSLEGSLENHEYEPDAPNFTPRITGVIERHAACWAQLSVLRKSAFNEVCDRFFFNYENIPAGFGYCVTTYTGNGDPLPAWKGEPQLMPLHGEIDEIMETYWAALDPEFRVALVVKFIPRSNGNAWSEIRIKNRFEKVA